MYLENISQLFVKLIRTCLTSHIFFRNMHMLKKQLFIVKTTIIYERKMLICVIKTQVN